MNILHFFARNFRNFSSLDLEFHPRLNLFYGENGSGKTALLESLFFLSRVKSFRTHLIQRIIQCEQNNMLLFAKLKDEKGWESSIGIERDLVKKGSLKISSEFATVAQASSLLPIQILHSDSFGLLTEGPKRRRQFLDWGGFYQYSDFFLSWHHYQRILKQRNSLIRQGASEQEMVAWNELFCQEANVLSKFRENYTQQFFSVFYPKISTFFSCDHLKIEFYPGWNKENLLSHILMNNLIRDRELGYTFYGAHRADLKITYGKIPAADLLSRGQQKIFVWLMKITQALLVSKQKSVLLIDDVHAEIDETRLIKICQLLKTIDCQLFVTAINKKQLKYFLSVFSDYSMFHVKHNKIIKE